MLYLKGVTLLPEVDEHVRHEVLGHASAVDVAEREAAQGLVRRPKQALEGPAIPVPEALGLLLRTTLPLTSPRRSCPGSLPLSSAAATEGRL